MGPFAPPPQMPTIPYLPLERSQQKGWQPMSKDKQEVNKDVQWWAPVVGDQELRLGLRGPGTKPLPPRKSLFSPSITSFVGGEVSPDWKGVAGRGGGIRPGPAQVALVVKNLPANAGDVRDGFHPWVGRGTWGGA